MSFINDQEFSRSLLPAFNEAAQEFVYRNRLIDFQFTEASLDLDRNSGIDMICVGNIYFAYRATRANRSHFFDQDFTIRLTNSRGGPSEWEKVLSGDYANYMLVGLQDESRPLKLCKIYLLNVQLIRIQLLGVDNLKNYLLENYTNENRSEPGKLFLTIPYDIFPENIVIDCLIYTDQ